MWQLGITHRLGGKQIAYSQPTDNEAEQLLAELMNRILAEFSSGFSPDAAPPAFTRRVGKILVDTANKVEQQHRLYLVPSLLATVGRMHGNEDETKRNIGTLAVFAAVALRLLVGSERRYLIGCRDNQPAWKKFERPIYGSLSSEQIADMNLVEWPYMAYLDQADAAFLPNWSDDKAVLREYQLPVAQRPAIQSLLAARAI